MKKEKKIFFNIKKKDLNFVIGLDFGLLIISDNYPIETNRDSQQFRLSVFGRKK